MAAQFDQASDRVSRSGSVPDPATACTVLGWVRVDTDTNLTATLARIWTAGLTTVATFATGGDGLTGPNYFTAGGSVLSSTSLAVGQWFCFAFACSGTNATVYVAPETGSVTVTNGSVSGQTPPGGITLGGRDTSDGSENLIGSLAYVRVFAAKLTQAQVEAEWASANAILAAWADWPLVANLNDTSGNSRHLSPGTTAVAFVAGPNLPGGSATAVLEGSVPMPTMDATAVVTAEADLFASVPLPTFDGTITEQVAATATLDAIVPLPVGGAGLMSEVDDELQSQRDLTKEFIDSRPVVIALTPVSEIRKPSGGTAYVPQAARQPQTFRLIPMSHTERPRQSSSAAASADAGVQRRYDYTLLGEWNAEMRENDFWITPENQKLVIEAMVSDNGYERKGLVISYGRNPSHAPE